MDDVSDGSGRCGGARDLRGHRARRPRARRAARRRGPEPRAARDENGVSAVLAALYRGQDEIAELLLSYEPELDIFDAAAVGRLERARELVGRDRSLANAVAPDGFSPLGLAAFFGRPAVVEHLLANGADPSRPAQNAMRVTPLHSAVAGAGHPEIARTLIEAGSDVNARQRHGWTPLQGAAQAGDRATVELLLARGADPRAANDAGKTALDVAREHGHENVVRVLEERGRTA